MYTRLLLTGASLLPGLTAASVTCAASPAIVSDHAETGTRAAVKAKEAPVPGSGREERAASWSEMITVSAARRPIRADEIGTAMTIITEKQIQTQQRRSLTDILERQAGLNIVQTGGMGGASSIFMRGSNSNEVKVRLDGMDVNDGSNTDGGFDAAHYMTDGIGRIEILRGPQSGLYGADAMAGVIDITTAQGQGRFRPFVRMEGGSYGTFNQVLGMRGSEGRFHYNVTLSHYRQVGFHCVPEYN